MSSNILHNDRCWFDRHPNAVVRFRRQRVGEFADLHAKGDQAPVFRPSFSSEEALTWVAVVDLFQLLRDSKAAADGTRMRLRLRTIPIRSTEARSQAKRELIKAVARDLLERVLLEEALQSSPEVA